MENDNSIEKVSKIKVIGLVLNIFEVRYWGEDILVIDFVGNELFEKEVGLMGGEK